MKGVNKMVVLKTVHSEELLTVLALKSAKHMRPQPHSQQSGLQLVIHFSEFAKLCSGIRQYGEQILTETSEKLDNLAKRHTLVESANRELKSIFLREVALAVMREVHYHQRSGRGLTSIRYFIQGHNEIDAKLASEKQSDIVKPLDKLLELTSRNGYPVTAEGIDIKSYEAITYAIQTYVKSTMYAKNLTNT